MTHVQFSDVEFTYPGDTDPVLAGVDAAVPDGELLCILGSSGSGKSTLLHLLAGLLRPSGGDISLNGESVVKVAAHKRKVTLLSQKALLFPFTTVAGNVAFAPRLKGASRKTRLSRVGELLELVGLSGYEDRSPQSLSGGEAQRVALARALAADPSVLLMDEPFSNLDTPIRVELQQAFRELHRQKNLTTLFVTHQVDEAMAMGDTVATLVDGVVDVVDVPEAVFERPPTVGAARLVGIKHFLEGDWDGSTLSGVWGSITISEEPEGFDAVAAIRPERLRIRTGTDAVESEGLAGEVLDVVYRGSYSEVLVRLLGGTELVAHHSGGVFSVGSAVSVEASKDCWFAVQR